MISINLGGGGSRKRITPVLSEAEGNPRSTPVSSLDSIASVGFRGFVQMKANRGLRSMQLPRVIDAQSIPRPCLRCARASGAVDPRPLPRTKSRRHSEGCSRNTVSLAPRLRPSGFARDTISFGGNGGGGGSRTPVRKASRLADYMLSSFAGFRLPRSERARNAAG